MAFNSVKKATDLVPIKHVLASTYDKAGLADFVRGMVTSCPGVRFYSTGAASTPWRQPSVAAPTSSR